jgi:hypothetical protein
MLSDSRRLWPILAMVLSLGLVMQQPMLTSTEERDVPRSRTGCWDGIERARCNLELGDRRVFTDYQCPACRALLPQYASIVQAMSEHVAITLVHRDFPLDSSCNDVLPPDYKAPHPAACGGRGSSFVGESTDPAVGAAFQREQYANQTALTEGLIVERLATMGLASRFSEAKQELADKVREDIQIGARYGVKGTPALVLRGVLLPGNSSAELQSLLGFELAEMRRVSGTVEQR